MMRETSRRAILAGAAAVVATAAPAVAGTPHEDSAIVTLFCRWIAAQRSLQAMAAVADDDTFEAALDGPDDLAAEIARLPATTLADFGVKAYLCAYEQRGTPRHDYAAVDLPEDDGDDPLELALLRSMLADAARVVPEIAELVRIGGAA